MKHLSILFLLFLFSLNVFSQDIEKELKYLRIANKQQRHIIKDNLRNAEIIAFKLIKNPDNFKKNGASFLKELAKSYFLAKMYEHSIFTFYRQRCFFPETSNGKTLYYYTNAEEKIKKQKLNQLKILYEKTEPNNIPESYKSKFKLFLKTTYKSGFKKTDNLESIYTDLFSETTNSEKLPFWIKQRNFYYKIKIKPKRRQELYIFKKTDKNSLIPDSLTKKNKKLICRKAICYYRKIKNKEKRKKYVKICKEKLK